MDPKLDHDLDLHTRDGWPAELLFLAARFPRDDWEDHANLGALTKFWLQRHNMFRELGRALQSATMDFRGGVTLADEFSDWFTPRMQFFLNQLQLHHSIEDQHFFPLLIKAEPRLAPGFAALDRDHRLIAPKLVATAEAANAFLAVLDQQPADHRDVAQTYAVTSDALIADVFRHMDDEETLVVPLSLDRGEAALGVSDTFELTEGELPR